MQGLQQTPQKEGARSSDLVIRRSKETPLKSVKEHARKSSKIAKKSLSSAFSSVSKDVSIRLTEEPIDSYRISDVFDGNHQVGESTESFTPASTPILPSSSVASTSNISTCNGSGESEDSKIGSVEAELVVNHLRQARSQVWNSSDADIGSKKLLDALIKIVIEELNASPEERDWFAELVTAKARIAFLLLVLWFLCILLAFSFTSGVRRSFDGPLPT
ncbi:protein SINE3 [Malania oleifera]|uniref:protein SINE3 n=1 Tax=Malania oleifera TaxID=397392 RepID=UPI0025ADEF1B|nr:protein SINE3 [Malania oleifera]XP_057957335.1 protein SINE3 [Malania oleifera]